MTMSPGSEGSHESGDEHHDAPQSSKTPTVKDKECQYCRQKFTSSSLGRHLDQFISKKKPDGVHDVDEIRRLRGGITRRTAKNQKKEHDDTGSTQQSPSPQYTLPSYSELLNKTTTAPTGELRFNRMSWQATGVITDPPTLNPSSNSNSHSNPPSANIVSPPASTDAPPNTSAGTKRNFSTYVSDLPTLNPVASETTRALELSLREVLDAVRTATRKAAPSKQPFSFDFNAQTFPHLCLVLLPIPSTLFTATPFGTSTSIPLSPPGHEQYQTLSKTVEYLVDRWKWKKLAHVQRTSTGSFSEEMENLNDECATHVQSALQHLDAAYQNFMSFPLDSRQSLWTIELLRAYKTEQDKTKEANTRIERLLQESDQLQQQIDHLSRCQWPREMALWPPDRVTLDEKTRDELGVMNLIKGEINGPGDGNDESSTDDQQKSGIDRWDYEVLVNKWKKHVREDRTRRTGIQPSMPLLSGSGPQNLPDNHASAPSEHSTTSTPRLSSNLIKSAVSDYRGSSGGQNTEAGGLHHSPAVNGGVGGASGPANGFETRRRNFHFVSDVDDIFTPRFKGLRADSVMKSATP